MRELGRIKEDIEGQVPTFCTAVSERTRTDS